jgi:hypothetical protein
LLLLALKTIFHPKKKLLSASAIPITKNALTVSEFVEDEMKFID